MVINKQDDPEKPTFNAGTDFRNVRLEDEHFLRTSAPLAERLVHVRWLEHGLDDVMHGFLGIRSLSDLKEHRSALVLSGAGGIAGIETPIIEALIKAVDRVIDFPEAYCDLDMDERGSLTRSAEEALGNVASVATHHLASIDPIKLGVYLSLVAFLEAVWASCYQQLLDSYSPSEGDLSPETLDSFFRLSDPDDDTVSVT